MHYDLIVVGTGVCGLATGYQWLKAHPRSKILLIEKEARVAFHQSGRNSGVIHSGIYYKPGSQKALNCTRGYNLLLDFARTHGIAHEMCGKLIVATNESEIPFLEEIQRRGLKNGLANLDMLSKEQAREIEPHVSCVRALRVPQTGIIDFPGLAEKMKDLILEMGGHIHFEERVLHVKNEKDITVETDRNVFVAQRLINCAGLYSDKVARGSGDGLEKDVRIIPFRGEYYELNTSAEHLVKGLIYPVPNPQFPFLGVHFTRMIHGGVEAGPNAVFALGREAYTHWQMNFPELFESVTWPGFIKMARKHWRYGFGEMHRSFSKKAFTRSLQKLIPEIQISDLKPGGAGIRAQACHRDGSLVDDFAISRSNQVLNLLNAPSPAATSCLAIGESLVRSFA